MLLAFEVVLFGGLAFMFFCILRNQDSMLKTMREEHGAILSTLAKLEKRIATLQQLEASIAINPLATARTRSNICAAVTSCHRRVSSSCHWATTSSASRAARKASSE